MAKSTTELYDEIGKAFCSHFDIVPGQLYNQLAIKEDLLREYLTDIVISHYNGDNIVNYINENIDKYKEIINWKEEYEPYLGEE